MAVARKLAGIGPGFGRPGCAINTPPSPRGKVAMLSLADRGLPFRAAILTSEPRKCVQPRHPPANAIKTDSTDWRHKSGAGRSRVNGWTTCGRCCASRSEPSASRDNNGEACSVALLRVSGVVQKKPVLRLACRSGCSRVVDVRLFGATCVAASLRRFD